jgi:hypothetical protein
VDTGPDPELSRQITPLLDSEAAFPGGLARAAVLVASSARRAGLGAVVSGRWLTSLLLDIAPRLPIRDQATLVRHHGCSGTTLADALIVNAARTTAAIGAAAGTLAGAAEATGAGVATLPAPVLADTLLTALVEIKLIAELHEALGRPIPGRPTERALLLARAWAQGRGVPGDALASGGSFLAATTAQHQIARLVKGRLLRRTGRSLWTLVPVLAGAVAGAQVNRRGTRRLAAAVRDDLR